MISVRAVSKSFGRVSAVREVSFEVGRGEVVGLLGANGAGKTTTIRMVTGFLPPDQGAVSVAGHDTLNESLAARRTVGYLPESAPAYGEMATEDYLHYRGRLYGLGRSQRRMAVEKSLSMCELGEVRRRRVGHLSRGFRQRVGLAAAILHEPRVLVLDEPTSALDPKQIRQTRAVIRELARERAVLVSSHILPEVEQTCDRVVVMARGRVRAAGRPGELVLRTQTPYIAETRGEALANAAPGIPGVDRVEREPLSEGWVRLRVFPTPQAADLREAIAAAALAAGSTVRELRRETPGLERVFMDLLQSEDSGGTA